MIHVSEQYAEALYNAAESMRCVDDVCGDMRAMPELAELFSSYHANPRIGTNEKKRVIRELLAGKLNPLTLEFILLLLGRNHWKHLAGISTHFLRLYDAFSNKAVVQLTTPFEPDQAMQARLKARLIEKGLIPKDAKEITIETIKDASIIGGFIAVCGGRRIDASLRTRLAKIRHSESQV